MLSISALHLVTLPIILLAKYRVHSRTSWSCTLKMKVRLTVEDGSSGFLISHKELLLNSYYQWDKVADTKYELKDDVFVFTENGGTSASTRRRKKKTTIDHEPVTLTKESSIDLQNIQTSIETLIKRCKDNKLLPTLPEERVSNIHHVIEDSERLPNLLGRNDLNSPRVTKFGRSEYLIPPKCVFYNNDIDKLSELLPTTQKFDLIVLDPPWRNKYVRRLKTVRPELSYRMLKNDNLADIPVERLINKSSIVAIWCTNSPLHHKDVLERFLPKWDLKLVARWFWVKLNHRGQLVCPFREMAQKQPFEHLFIACHKDNEQLQLKEEFLLSVASTIHSHKPPLLELFKSDLPENPKCLELFARYLYPGFTSVGLEVLKLQDIRLYDAQKQRNEK